MAVPYYETLTGKRNRAILAILLGCGLRRRELAELVLESYSVARSAGPLWTWSAKEGTYEPSPYRIG